MQININLEQYNKQDTEIIKNNIKDIINYGLSIYKKKNNINLTPTEKIVYDIIYQNRGRCLSKETIATMYNEQVYGDSTEKYIQPQNVVTKINRLNRKIKEGKILNRYGFGYIIRT